MPVSTGWSPSRNVWYVGRLGPVYKRLRKGILSKTDVSDAVLSVSVEDIVVVFDCAVFIDVLPWED